MMEVVPQFTLSFLFFFNHLSFLSCWRPALQVVLKGHEIMSKIMGTMTGWWGHNRKCQLRNKYRKDMINVLFFFFLWKRCVYEPNQARNRFLTGKNVLLSNCAWPIIKGLHLLLNLILITTSQINWLTFMNVTEV